MSDITSISASALTAAATRLNVIGNNLAHINAPNVMVASVATQENPSGGFGAIAYKGQDTVNISQEAVNMVAAMGDVTTNITAVKASNETMKKVLDIMA